MPAVLLEREYVRSLVADAVSALSEAISGLMSRDGVTGNEPFLDELSLLAFGNEMHPLAHDEDVHYRKLIRLKIAHNYLPGGRPLIGNEPDELNSLHLKRVLGLKAAFSAAGLANGNGRNASYFAQDYVLAQATSSPGAAWVIPRFVSGSEEPFSSFAASAVQECLQSASISASSDKAADIGDILYAAQLADGQKILVASGISLPRNGPGSATRSGLDIIMQSISEKPIPALNASHLGEIVAGNLIGLCNVVYSMMRPAPSNGHSSDLVYTQAAGNLLRESGPRKSARGKEFVALALAAAIAIQPSSELADAASRLARRLRLSLEAPTPSGQYRQ